VDKNNLRRYKAGLAAAFMLSSGVLLSGCKDKGFELTVNEDRNYVATEDSYVSNEFLEKCYVVEAKSLLTEESNIYIVNRKFSPDRFLTSYEYIDVFTNRLLFYSSNIDNTSFEIIKQAPLLDYLISLNLVKDSYSYEDMQRIYEEIKAVYEYESDKELVK